MRRIHARDDFPMPFTRDGSMVCVMVEQSYGVISSWWRPYNQVVAEHRWVKAPHAGYLRWPEFEAALAGA